MSKNSLEKIVSDLISQGEQLEISLNHKKQTFIQKFIEKANTIEIPYNITLRQIKRTERLFNYYKETSPEKFIEQIKKGKGYGIISSATLAESLGFNEFALNLLVGLDRDNIRIKTRCKKLKWIMNNENTDDFINSLSNEELIYAGRIFLSQKREDMVSRISQKLCEKKDIYEAIAFIAYIGDYQKAINYLSENWKHHFEGDKIIIVAHYLRKREFPSSLFYKKALECYEKNGSKRSIRYARRFFKKTSKLEEKSNNYLKTRS